MITKYWICSWMKLLRHGNDIPSSSPLYEYKPFFKELSLLDLPSGSLVIFNMSRVVIPVCLRSKILDILHKHHFAERVMLAAASNTIWWPGINGQIMSKYINCTICMQIKRTNNPSTPISEAAANIAIMYILSLDWMSIGTLHYLIIVEKVTSFIWSRLFSNMPLPIVYLCFLTS